jgi:hypothetical protein
LRELLLHFLQLPLQQLRLLLQQLVWRSSFWILSVSDIDCAEAMAGTASHTLRMALHAIRFCRMLMTALPSKTHYSS